MNHFRTRIDGNLVPCTLILFPWLIFHLRGPFVFGWGTAVYFTHASVCVFVLMRVMCVHACIHPHRIQWPLCWGPIVSYMYLRTNYFLNPYVLWSGTVHSQWLPPCEINYDIHPIFMFLYESTMFILTKISFFSFSVFMGVCNDIWIDGHKSYWSLPIWNIGF